MRVGTTVAMGLLSAVIFYLNFNCCAWVYILKFYHLKIVSGAEDARKWSAKWRNWNISGIFFSLSSIEGRKQQRRPETFAPCMGTIPSERARQENSFLVSKRIVLTLVTLHVHEEFRSYEDRLNTLIRNNLLENWKMWLTVTFPPS